MIRNYFADLELDLSASLDDVRRAYRRLARRFHPDLNPLDKQSEESFYRIQEAFDFLSSETRFEKLKKQLVEPGRTSKKLVAQKWGEYPLVPVSTDQFIGEWKEESSVRKKFHRPEENLDVWILMEVNRADLKSEIVKTIAVPHEHPCGSCRGLGGRAKAARATCKKCAGLGHFLIERGAMHWRKTCDLCLGKGYLSLSPCSTCGGRGKVGERQKIEIRIPKKTDVKRPIIVRGFGHISFDGKKRGDLWVQLTVKD